MIKVVLTVGEDYDNYFFISCVSLLLFFVIVVSFENRMCSKWFHHSVTEDSAFSEPSNNQLLTFLLSWQKNCLLFSFFSV